MKSPAALVTGASRGIGASIATGLAQDGYTVIINSYPDDDQVSQASRTAQVIRARGGRAEVIAADIGNAPDVELLFSRGENLVGPIAVLVNNAAATARLPWTSISEDDWDRVMTVNLKGAFLCARRAYADNKPTSLRSVINIGSVLAVTGGSHSLHYITSKAGLIGFTRSLACELGDAGVRVNCVLPGAIKTESEGELFDGVDMDEQVLQKQVIQRRGVPDDVARVVRFLASDESSFITGQAFRADGGWGVNA